MHVPTAAQSWYHCLFDIFMKSFEELNQLKTLYCGFVWLIFDWFSSLDWPVTGSDPCRDQYKRGVRNIWLAEQGEKEPTSASLTAAT